MVLRGKVKVTIFNDDGSIKEFIILDPEKGLYGVDIPKNVWHTLESLESDSVIFECEEGVFERLEEEGMLTLR